MKLYTFRPVHLSSSGVYSLYTQQWYMSYRYVGSCRVGPGWNCILVPLVDFITKKFVTMHGHMNVKTKNYINCDDGTYATSDRVIRNNMERRLSRDSPWLGFLVLFSILLSAKVLLLASIIRITPTLFDVLGCSDVVHDGYKTVLFGE
jgi:hypothetical protein